MVKPNRSTPRASTGSKKGGSSSKSTITPEEIDECLEMKRQIRGRVEMLEADGASTVYFLMDTKASGSCCLWYEGYTFWAPYANSAETLTNDDESFVDPGDIASFVTLATVIKGVDRVYDPKYSYVSYIKGWEGTIHHDTFAARISCARNEMDLHRQIEINLPDQYRVLSTAQLTVEGSDTLECYGKAVLFVKASKTISTKLYFLVRATTSGSKSKMEWIGRQHNDGYGDSKITEFYTRYATVDYGIELVDTGRHDLFMSVLNLEEIVAESEDHVKTLLEAISKKG